MAGTILDRELVGSVRPGVRFALGTERDEPAIRQLLRRNPIRGRISLTFERGPHRMSGRALAGAEDQTIVAFHGERMVCLGRATVRRGYLNGQPCRVGYLGELRLDASARGRFDILRRGYQFFRELPWSTPPVAWFTSIAADNHRALRFLEANVPGMPRYEFVSEFVTLLISVPQRASVAQRLAASAARQLERDGLRCVWGSQQPLPELAVILTQVGREFQFATEWTVEQIQALEPHGLARKGRLLVMDGSQAVAASALWDQRAFRRTVIRGYGRGLALARPGLNVLAAIFGVAGLPAVGSTLAHAFLSPIAIEAGRRDLVSRLVALQLARARERGLEFLTLGLSSQDENRRTLPRHFHCREYRSRIYRVFWPERDGGPELDSRAVLPEVALL